MAGYDPEATYNTLVADVGLQDAWAEGSFNEAETNLDVGNRAAEQGLAEAKPGVERQEENAASRGGILHSGTSGRRQTTIAANFAARRAANERALAEGHGRITRERQAGQLQRQERLHAGQTEDAYQKDQIAKANPVVAPAANGFYGTYPTGDNKNVNVNHARDQEWGRTPARAGAKRRSARVG